MMLRTIDSLTKEKFPPSGEPSTRYIEEQEARRQILQTWAVLRVNGNEMQIRNAGPLKDELRARGWKAGLGTMNKRVKTTLELVTELKNLNKFDADIAAADDRLTTLI